MNVLSIQSSVAYGHVGNGAAVFVLNRLGHEAWAVPTVLFSNHPGHGRHRGRAIPSDELEGLIRGIDEVGALAQCGALLSGYLGEAGQGPVLARTAARLRALNPAALWLCDPVIGDGGRVFVRDGIPEFLRDEAVPAADIVTPNAFELEWLTGRRIATWPDALAAARGLAARTSHARPRLVVVTGLRLPDQPPQTVAMLAVRGDAAWRVTMPDFPGVFSGAGDAFAALLLGRLLSDRRPGPALSWAASAVHAIVAATAAAKAPELAIIATQGAWLRPRPRFAAEPLPGALNVCHGAVK